MTTILINNFTDCFADLPLFGSFIWSFRCTTHCHMMRPAGPLSTEAETTFHTFNCVSSQLNQPCCTICTSLIFCFLSTHAYDIALLHSLLKKRYLNLKCSHSPLAQDPFQVPYFFLTYHCIEC